MEITTYDQGKKSLPVTKSKEDYLEKFHASSLYESFKKRGTSLELALAFFIAFELKVTMEYEDYLFLCRTVKTIEDIKAL